MPKMVLEDQPFVLFNGVNFTKHGKTFTAIQDDHLENLSVLDAIKVL